MRKNYWKECCLLLIGLILGYLYHKYSNSLPIKHTNIVVVRDTIIKHDTTYAKIIESPLNGKSVLAELKKQEIPCSHIVYKQAKLESGNFNSSLTKTHNNIFGIKKGTKYKKYNNYKECISDYKRLISSKYKGGDYYVFLTNIKYAEDPNYIQKLKNLS